MTRIERLAPLDAWFWEAEGPTDHQHIGSIAVLEGPPPRPADIRRRVLEVMLTVPRATQRCEPGPFGLARPTWVDVDLDADYHVRRTALPDPGDDEELFTLFGRIMSQPLDRTRPLWELWVVTGLADGRWAIVNKTHHSVVDGIAGVQLLMGLYDLGPEPEPASPAPPPTAPPNRWEQATDVVAGLVRDPLDGLRRVVAAARHPVRASRSAGRIAFGALDLVQGLLPTTHHGLNAQVGPHRLYHVARGEVDAVREVRRATGVTFNDVVLAAICRGYAELLRSRGHHLEPTDHIRALVPVSVRTLDEREETNNRVSVLLVDLPIGITDPLALLARIHTEEERHKGSGEADAGVAFLGALAALPAPLVTLVTRAIGFGFDHGLQRGVTTVTTNIPGPPVPLYAVGRRVLELLPYVLVGEGLTTGVAVMSYDGKLAFGVTGDRDASPDVEVLAAGIEAGLAGLVAAVRQAAAPELVPTA